MVWCRSLCQRPLHLDMGIDVCVSVSEFATIQRPASPSQLLHPLYTPAGYVGQGAPFSCMDEFDVFMDAVNRR